MERFQNREQAGMILVKFLKNYANLKNVIVLALPRGGVPVAYQIAKALHAPLDVFVVRKLGVPGHEELAMGAIATGDVLVFNQSIINSLHIKEHSIKDVIASEKLELARRERKYRGNQAYPELNSKIVILVDDGIATGATIRAAIKALKQYLPQKIIVAVPVAQKDTCNELKKVVDEVVCPLQPDDLGAVGAWYADFSQTEDEEVYSLLKEAKQYG